MPRVSVIMGVYNASKRIEKSVKSILEQTFTDFEFIICDDCSDDDTFIKLEKIASNDSRITILRNDKNMKLAYTLNKCLKIAKGDLIARMDDDDYAKPDRFEKQIEFMDKNPMYDIVGSTSEIFDENGVFAKGGKSGEILIIDIIKGKGFIHPSVIIRKNVLDIVHGYSDTKETLRTEDLDLWYKIYSTNGKGYVLEDPLLLYYESISSMKRRKYKFRINEFKVKYKIFKEFKMPFRYIIYPIKPLLVGLLPSFIIKNLHKQK